MIAPGQRVGHYLIEQRLGAGGMGEVFRAFDESLERPVAIKVLPKAVEKHPEALARMLREARAASALVHANIVTVHEVDEFDGQTILVMELVEGETLAHLVARRGKLPPAEAIALVREVGVALEFAHQAGFVHRDIKCSNLMITPTGRVKVLDFGLSKRMRRAANGDGARPAAKEIDTVAMRRAATAPDSGAAPAVPDAPRAVDVMTAPGKAGAPVGRPPSMPAHDVDPIAQTEAHVPRRASASDDLTVAGVAMGTPGYSALELMDGLEADGRADVFSLGVVLYELLTAARPFTGVAWAEVRAQIAAERYQRARQLVPELSSALDEVIEGALRADRAQRTPSVAAMLGQLARASRTRARRRTLALVLGAIAVTGGTTWAALRVRRGGGHAAVVATADAGLAVPGPDPRLTADGADGGRVDDAGAAVPVAGPRQTTHSGGCAHAPVFLDDNTLAFDLTLPGGAPDLHVLDLDAEAGRPPRQLTRAASWEWQAALGVAPNELAYVVTDPVDGVRSYVATLDLATGIEHELVPGVAAAVATAGDAYYYVRADGAELRRMRGKIDEHAATLTGVLTATALAPARDGRRLAVAVRTAQHPHAICIVTLADRTVRCPPTLAPLGGRPAFGLVDTLYYGAVDGVRARAPTGNDLVVVPGALAPGGVAVSPSGRTLVWSSCDADRDPPDRDKDGAPAVSDPPRGELWRLDAPAGATW